MAPSLTTKKTPSPSASNPLAGATMVEASLTVLVFLALVLAIIDLGRAFFVYVILSFSAHEGVDYASKIPIGLNTRAAQCTTAEGDDQSTTNCDLFQARLAAVGERITRMADMVASRPGSGSMTELRSFTHFLPEDGRFSDSGLTPQTLPYAFIRPGEAVVRDDGAVIEHPTRPSSEGWPGGAQNAGESWGDVFREHHLEVRVEATFETVTPFLPSLNFVARQLAFSASGEPSQRAPELREPTPTVDPGETPEAGETPSTPIASETPEESCECGVCRYMSVGENQFVNVAQMNADGNGACIGWCQDNISGCVNGPDCTCCNPDGSITRDTAEERSRCAATDSEYCYDNCGSERPPTPEPTVANCETCCPLGGGMGLPCDAPWSRGYCESQGCYDNEADCSDNCCRVVSDGSGGWVWEPIPDTICDWDGSFTAADCEACNGPPSEPTAEPTNTTAPTHTPTNTPDPNAPTNTPTATATNTRTATDTPVIPDTPEPEDTVPPEATCPPSEPFCCSLNPDEDCSVDERHCCTSTGS